MAVIAHPNVAQNTVQRHVGDANWTDISGAEIGAGSFVGNATYLIVAVAPYGSTNAAVRVGIRLLHASTVFSGSQSSIEPQGSVDVRLHPYFYMARFVQPATPELIKLQFQIDSTIHTAHVDTISIFTMRLDADLTENVDYVYAEDDDTGGSTALTTTWAEFANIVWTPGNADDDWLIIGSSAWEVNATDSTTFTRLRRGIDPASPDDDQPQFSEEGEDTAEVRVEGLHRVFTLPSSSIEMAVDMKDGAAANVDNHSRSAIFALRLDSFEDHAFFWNVAEVDPGAGGAEIGNIDITPTTTGDFLLLGFAVSDVESVSRAMNIQFTVDGTETPTGVYSHSAAVAWDPTDENPMVIMAVPSLASGASRDLDFDAKEALADTVAEDRSFVVFSMELAAEAVGNTRRYALTTLGVG